MTPTFHSLIIFLCTLNVIAVGKFANLPTYILGQFKLEPEVTMSLPDMVKYLGYPLETHDVVTDDDYILTVHRIPHGRYGKPADPNKLPIVLIHCICCSSDLWISNIPEKSPGFLLADAGFDVWMVNFRGNEYSRKHKRLNTSQAAFWDFSVDEVGYYDMASFIDDVINKTGKPRVYLLGHSMGGVLPFLLLAARPEYDVKVKEIYALSPFGSLAGVRGLLHLGLKVLPPIFVILQRLGIYDVPRLPKAILGYLIKYNDYVFKSLMALISGPFPDNWNATRSPVFGVRFRFAMALNLLRHYVQFANKPGFRYFDMGRKKNLAKYNQSTPPYYDFKKVVATAHLYYATNDHLVTKTSMEDLRKNLANVVSYNVIGHNSNHLSYLWGDDADVFLNQLVATILKSSRQT